MDEALILGVALGYVAMGVLSARGLRSPRHSGGIG